MITNDDRIQWLRERVAYIGLSFIDYIDCMIGSGK